jgi:hypothetical protein
MFAIVTPIVVLPETASTLKARLWAIGAVEITINVGHRIRVMRDTA